MRKFLTLATTVLFACFAAPASADESWTSPVVGQIVWQTDVEDTSVFTYQAGDRTVYMYIEGLPNNMSNRQVMTGYWMMEDASPSDGQCGAAITAVDGRSSHTWGHFEMRWQRRTFPSGWTAKMTECFAGPGTMLRARPVVGG